MGNVIRYLPWAIFWSLVGFGLLGVGFALMGIDLPWSILGVCLLALAYIEWDAGKKNVPASKPASKAVLTFWGNRTGRWIGPTPIILDEGDHLVMPYWPFKIDLIPFSVTKVNRDEIPVMDIICKSETIEGQGDGGLGAGGRVNVYYSYTFIPDTEHPERIIDYVNSDYADGVAQIIEDRAAEVLRQSGRDNTWEQLQFSSDKLTAMVLVKLSGEKPIALEIDPSDPNGKKTFRDHKGKPKEATIDVPGEPEPVPLVKEVEDCTVDEIDYFLDKIHENHGYTDVQDLGIIILRFNIEKVELTGTLKTVAEKAVTEQEERRAEVYEIDTELKQAQKLYDKYKEVGSSKTMEDCVMEIRRRKVQREGKSVQTFEIPGLVEAAGAIATAFATIKQQPPTHKPTRRSKRGGSKEGGSKK